MNKSNLLDCTKEQLGEIFKPSFRAKQIYQWVYGKYVNSYSQMKNLPKEIRENLEKNYILNPLKLLKKEIAMMKV